mmetsp:Transcript_4872/g.8357  ORF Transcript_4872/g.8357 Transcript_4872/m.8357 type:complete len:87 (+) Transcript_4872:1057-1317(+)
MAVCIPDIGTVISIAGATVNPFIGFLFPIIFYLKIENDIMLRLLRSDQITMGEYGGVRRQLKRTFAVFVGIIISIISVAGFIELFK